MMSDMCYLTNHNAFALSGRQQKKQHIVLGTISPVITGLVDKDEAAQSPAPP